MQVYSRLDSIVAKPAVSKQPMKPTVSFQIASDKIGLVMGAQQSNINNVRACHKVEDIQLYPKQPICQVNIKYKTGDVTAAFAAKRQIIRSICDTKPILTEQVILSELREDTMFRFVPISEIECSLQIIDGSSDKNLNYSKRIRGIVNGEHSDIHFRICNNFNSYIKGIENSATLKIRAEKADIGYYALSRSILFQKVPQFLRGIDLDFENFKHLIEMKRLVLSINSHSEIIRQVSEKLHDKVPTENKAVVDTLTCTGFYSDEKSNWHHFVQELRSGGSQKDSISFPTTVPIHHSYRPVKINILNFTSNSDNSLQIVLRFKPQTTPGPDNYPKEFNSYFENALQLLKSQTNVSNTEKIVEFPALASLKISTVCDAKRILCKYPNVPDPSRSLIVEPVTRKYSYFDMEGTNGNRVVVKELLDSKGKSMLCVSNGNGNSIHSVIGDPIFQANSFKDTSQLTESISKLLQDCRTILM